MITCGLVCRKRAEERSRFCTIGEIISTKLPLPEDVLLTYVQALGWYRLDNN